jgi:hypothetical protein
MGSRSSTVCRRTINDNILRKVGLGAILEPNPAMKS